MSSNSTTTKKSIIREPTIEDAVKSLLFNDELSDIRIQCNDGTILPANRVILAARSEVFKKMLFGNFQEASDRVIRVDYNGVVVQAILEFIYTNDAPVLSILLEDETANFVEDVLPGSVDTLVSVAAAADCFNLPTLYQTVCQLMQDHPDLTCLFLDASLAQGLPSPENDDESLLNLALHSLWSNPSLLLQSEYLGQMSPNTLKRFLKGSEIVASELELFNMIVKWADHNDKGITLVEDDFEDKPSRLDSARTMTQYIQLQHVPPHQLAEEITKSGLVTKDQLLEAYKAQAMQAAAAIDLEDVFQRFPKRRGCFTWKYSASTVWTPSSQKLETKLLDGPAMKSGSSYQWTIHIESNCADAWLGMVATGSSSSSSPPSSPKSVVSPHAFLGTQQGDWIHGSYGFGCHDFEGSDGEMKYPGFQQGDNVTFVFSISPSHDHELKKRTSFFSVASSSNKDDDEVKKVTLRVSVNDGPSVKIFVDMPPKDDETNNGGFLPAVSLKSPGSVRLVKFEKLS